MEITTVKLGPGDACLVVRESGEILVAYPQGSTDEPALIVAGVALALNNEEWTRQLVERTRAKLGEKA